MKTATIQFPVYQLHEMDAKLLERTFFIFQQTVRTHIDLQQFKESYKDHLFFNNGMPYETIPGATELDIATIKEDGRTIGMCQGVAMAVNYGLRHETPGGIWSAAGMSVRECIKSGVDNFDLERLIPMFAMPEDAEAIAAYHFNNIPATDEKHVEAEEFLTQMNEALIAAGELAAALIGNEDDQDIHFKQENNTEYIRDMKEAYIDIIKESYNK